MYWNEAAEPAPNHTDVHLLMTIAALLRKQGVARAGEIARQLSLSRDEVRNRLINLQQRQLVVRPNKHHYTLSSDGINVVNSVLATRRILQRFFEDVLQVPKAVALTDACKMEHLLSAESAARLVTFMGHYLTDTEKIARFQHVLRDYAGGVSITGPRLAG
jgi:Mn-dependent DtxR family transcriptional regulator